MKKWISESSDQTISVGEKIGGNLLEGDIVALRGDLGAGKTTITKGIAKALGIADEITSPTYTLIAEYDGRIPLYHMDLYRISDSEEFDHLGVDHLLYGRGICIIEWSERAEESLPDDHITLTIKDVNGRREIFLEGRDW